MLPKLIEIAQQAGALIMQVYQETDFGIVAKADESPVTRADILSNQLICNELEILTPDCPIISEERPMPDYAVRSSYNKYWLIDPLDGTKEFIKRNDEFAINIALMENNEPIFGLVHLPALNETYWAEKGKGAWLLKDGKEQRLQADSFELSQSGLAIAVTRSHFNQATADFIGQFTFPRLLARGSSLKVLMLATGEAHLHPRFGTTMEWDVAAPHIILMEAGGHITQPDGSPLRYNKEDLRNPDYIAYGKLR